jgi:hypothetical protein
MFTTTLPHHDQVPPGLAVIDGGDVRALGGRGVDHGKEEVLGDGGVLDEFTKAVFQPKVIKFLLRKSKHMIRNKHNGRQDKPQVEKRNKCSETNNLVA